MVCPKCLKQRMPREKIVRKRGKGWLIEYCRVCGYNFEITEWGGKHDIPVKEVKESEKESNVDSKRKAKRFRFGFPGGAD
jgi:hypothetical protein